MLDRAETVNPIEAVDDQERGAAAGGDPRGQYRCGKRFAAKVDARDFDIDQLIGHEVR